MFITATLALVLIPGGSYVPFFAKPPVPVAVGAFFLDEFQVTNGDYLQFVAQAPEWRRSRAKRAFVERDYLTSWAGDTDVTAEQIDGPVTNVSWFAARAYCRSQGKRLPTTDEWEFAAGQTGLSAEASKDAILAWYGRPSRVKLAPVKSAPANAAGIHGMHALVWEWVDDFNSSFVGSDERFVCGAGASEATDARDYAAFMRFAFRSSLKAPYTIKDLGFRCAKDPPP